MKKSLIVANWKSNKTISEASLWLTQFASNYTKVEGKEAVICASFALLYTLKEQVTKLGIDLKLGAQDVSHFPGGPYTGEVNASQLSETSDYVIIGHSERRETFGEGEEILFEKVKRAIEEGITPIFCIQGENTKVPDGDMIIAYEPPSSISTSGPGAQPDSPENVKKVALSIKKQRLGDLFLYGGSVDSENVKSFMQEPEIDGVLVGSKSLSAEEFLRIYQNA